MVCSPHQYTLQKIARPYMPMAAYLPQINYQQKPTYQFLPQRQLYDTIKTNTLSMFTYQTQTIPQYTIQYQNNEPSRNTAGNIQFIPPVWTSVELEHSYTSSTQPIASPKQDYGLPLYRAAGIMKQVNPSEQKIRRDDLMQRIQQELATMNEEKLSEDHLCAA